MEKQIVKIGTVNVYQSDKGTVVDALKSKLNETEQELERVKKLLNEPDGQPENSDYELTPKFKQALEEVKDGEYTTMTLNEVLGLGKEDEYIQLDDSKKLFDVLKQIFIDYGLIFTNSEDFSYFDFMSECSKFNGTYSNTNGCVFLWIGNINSEYYYCFKEDFKLKLIATELDTKLEFSNKKVKINLSIDEFLKDENTPKVD